MAEHDIKMKVKFSESHPASESLNNIESEETLPTILHKIHGWYNKFSKDVFATQFINMSKTVSINAPRNISANEVGVSILLESNIGIYYRNIRNMEVDLCDPYVDIKSLNLAASGTNDSVIFITAIINVNKSFNSGDKLFSIRLSYLT